METEANPPARATCAPGNKQGGQQGRDLLRLCMPIEPGLGRERARKEEGLVDVMAAMARIYCTCLLEEAERSVVEGRGSYEK